jgi:hypothetical protein
MTILDAFGRPWLVIPTTCHGCEKKSKFIARVHIPDNDFDRAYCPTCFAEMNIEMKDEDLK